MKNITLISLFNLAIKHILLIILVAAVFAGATFSYCEFIATPRYSANGAIMVTNGAITTNTEAETETETESKNENNIQNTDISASINILDTVIDTLSTRGIYKELSEKLNNKYSYGSLKGRSVIAKRNNTRSLYIDVSFTAGTLLFLERPGKNFDGSAGINTGNLAQSALELRFHLRQMGLS